MNKIKVLFGIMALVILMGFSQKTHAQSAPVMYFCEKYDGGEVGISDRFTTGYLTVMVKCEYALGLSKVTIQFDKFNNSSNKFDYYKDFPYTVTPDMKYIFFSGDDLNFKAAGIYRVFLLDGSRKTVASALIEIVK
jgi:hypothetical protein